MPQLLASELSASALSDSSGELPNLLLGRSPVESELAHGTFPAMTMNNSVCDEAQPQANSLLLMLSTSSGNLHGSCIADIPHKSSTQQVHGAELYSEACLAG